MTVIQRWFIDWNIPCDVGLPQRVTEDQVKEALALGDCDDDMWCKAADVSQLELLLKRYLEDLATSRQSRDRARADLAIADAKIASLEAESIEQRGRLDALLEHYDGCPIGGRTMASDEID